MENTLTNIPIRLILTDVLPKYFEDVLSKQGGHTGLEGTEFTFVFDVSGEKYNYRAYDGKQIKINESDIDRPMVRIHMARQDIESMIASRNFDVLFSVQNYLNKTNYDIIQKLSGCMVIRLNNDDGSVYTIETVFNDTVDPKVTFSLNFSDSIAMIRKEKDPINLFLGGNMRIDGDMSFAMSVQPLFS